MRLAARNGAPVASTQQLITTSEDVERIALAVRSSAVMYFDLEFVSEGRYVPELAVLQVAWGEIEAPQVAAIDCLALVPHALFAVIADPAVQLVAHGAKQDLSLLSTRFEVTATSLWDTQIAAAFVGIGDQIGYAKLVERLVGVSLDKGAQYTAWLKRPLTADQLRYALDDVRYLPRVWSALHEMLAASHRLEWVREESARLVASASQRVPPQEAYLDIKGSRALKGKALGALKALASWRMEEALASNRPPSWILADRAMLEVCKAGAKNERELRAARGVGDGTVRRYGAAILAAIAHGSQRPVKGDSVLPRPLSPRAQMWAQIVASLVNARCAESGIAPRFVATKSEAEVLAEWADGGGERGTSEPAIDLLTGWRRELAGEAALAWLFGDASIEVDREGPAGLKLRQQ